MRGKKIYTGKVRYSGWPFINENRKNHYIIRANNSPGCSYFVVSKWVGNKSSNGYDLSRGII